MTEGAASVKQVRLRQGVTRWLWFGAGWLSVGVGGVGVVVPGLPTTVFFIVAASCFARSSPRFEQWVLDRPGVGPLVRDYRAGLGMPRRTKGIAVAMMLLAAGLSALVAVENVAVSTVIIAAAAIGSWYVLRRVPTREVVLAQRSREATGPGSAVGEPRPGPRPDASA